MLYQLWARTEKRTADGKYVTLPWQMVDFYLDMAAADGVIGLLPKDCEWRLVKVDLVRQGGAL